MGNRRGPSFLTDRAGDPLSSAKAPAQSSELKQKLQRKLDQAWVADLRAHHPER
jgi:hypothetical protein